MSTKTKKAPKARAPKMSKSAARAEGAAKTGRTRKAATAKTQGRIAKGDSGPLHVAATTETPIVEILGPTMGSRSSPWRSPRFFAELIDAGPLPCRPCDERTCVPGDFRCLTQISPDRVAAAAERALAIAEHGAR